MSVAVSRNRIRRAERHAAGLCVDCGRWPHTATSKRCMRCRSKHSSSQRVYLNRLDPTGGHTDGLMTFEQIGTNLNISRERARHIYLRALVKLRRQCKRMGIDANDIVDKGFSMLATAERWADE